MLVPAVLRDTLLRAAEAYLYRAIWSAEILAEVESALVQKIGISPNQAARLSNALREVFPEAIVEGYETLTKAIAVDPKDRHVAAAAVRGGAQVIVTRNVKDFPDDVLALLGIEALSPDEFLQDLFDLDSERMLIIVTEQAAALENPPQTPREICASLRQFAPGFAALIETKLPEG